VAVAGVFGAHSSAESAPLLVRPDMRPEPPRLAVRRQSGAGHELTWTMAPCVPPVARFLLRVAERPERSLELVASERSALLAVTATDDVLTAQVIAVLADGSELASAALALRLAETAGVALTLGDTTSTTAMLTWSTPSTLQDIKQHMVFCETAGSAGRQSFAVPGGAAATSFRLDNLTAGLAYTVWVDTVLDPATTTTTTTKAPSKRKASVGQPATEHLQVTK
jgi:hypothetical protein